MEQSMNDRHERLPAAATVSALTPAHVRAFYPGAQSQTYLDVAGRCLIGTTVREAIDRHLDMRMLGALGDGHDRADDGAMQSLHDQLAANGVKRSLRRGALRFSIHVYNEGYDIDRVLALVDAWQPADCRAAR